MAKKPTKQTRKPRAKKTPAKATKPKRGRPPVKITEKDIKQLEEMAAMGMDRESICRVLGISMSTLRNRRLTNENIDNAYKRGVARGLEKATDKLHKHIDEGNLTALLFFLKTRHQWRETQKIETHQKLEHAGADGKELKTGTTINIDDSISDKKLKEVIKALKQA